MKVVGFLGSQAGRVVRAALGLIMIGVGVALGGGWWALAAVGLVPLAAAVFDVCLFAPLTGRPFSGRAFRAGH
jgi:hypothetical protein